MSTPCQTYIGWIEDVLSAADDALSFLKSINVFGWANSYINEILSTISELKGDLSSIEANDCAEIDTIISWVETIAGWITTLMSL
ncbi:MAG: hypothetical protein WB800_25540 [Streptosporangiaceae bacterium]|jgi:hypothetical protein